MNCSRASATNKLHLEGAVQHICLPNKVGNRKEQFRKYVCLTRRLGIGMDQNAIRLSSPNVDRQPLPINT